MLFITCIADTTTVTKRMLAYGGKSSRLWINSFTFSVSSFLQLIIVDGLVEGETFGSCTTGRDVWLEPGVLENITLCRQLDTWWKVCALYTTHWRQLTTWFTHCTLCKPCTLYILYVMHTVRFAMYLLHNARFVSTAHYTYCTYCTLHAL